MANSIGHQSPGSTLPPFKFKTLNTLTWGAGGNSVTIADQYIYANSTVYVYVVGTTPAVGNWAFNVTEGQCVVTSSSPESSTLTLAYIVF